PRLVGRTRQDLDSPFPEDLGAGRHLGPRDPECSLQREYALWRRRLGEHQTASRECQGPGADAEPDPLVTALLVQRDAEGGGVELAHGGEVAGEDHGVIDEAYGDSWVHVSFGWLGRWSAAERQVVG